MPNYSKTNYADIENSSKSEGIEAKFSRSTLETQDFGVSLFKYAPDFQSTMGHKHQVQEEAYVVVGGSGQILIDGEVIELKLWDVLRVEPEAVRAFAAGSEGLNIIAVGGDKPEGGDGERVEVTWPA
jgi:mannose-6-phosphate isomerase-like protein (cupin superfamily)